MDKELEQDGERAGEVCADHPFQDAKVGFDVRKLGFVAGFSFGTGFFRWAFGVCAEVCRGRPSKGLKGAPAAGVFSQSRHSPANPRPA